MGRDKNAVKRILEENISIHAPAWGATITMKIDIDNCMNFNSRARMGRDLCSARKCGAVINFNSRARMGRDEQRSKS